MPVHAGSWKTLREQLQKLRAEVPAQADALHAMENRLEALTEEVRRLSGARDAEPFVQKAIDELREEVHVLSQRLARTQQRLAETPEPACASAMTRAPTSRPRRCGCSSTWS